MRIEAGADLCLPTLRQQRDADGVLAGRVGNAWPSDVRLAITTSIFLAAAYPWYGPVTTAGN
jgi:hypothetical protein